MKHFNVDKKARIFVVMAVIAMALLPPMGNHLQDIWQSPGRLEAIEADIVEINERIRFIEDENRVITTR